MNRKRKRKNHDNHQPPCGFIPTAARMSISIRYFAGGSPYDLMSVHGVGYNDVDKLYGI